MERHIRGMLRRLYRLAILPIAIRLIRFAQTDSALFGVIGLEAGEQADVPFLLVALAIAIHLRQPIGDLGRLGVNRRGGGIGKLRGREHRRVAIRHRLPRRRHLHCRHRRRCPDDFGYRRFVFATSRRDEDEKNERALHARTQRNHLVV